MVERHEDLAQEDRDVVRPAVVGVRLDMEVLRQIGTGASNAEIAEIAEIAESLVITEATVKSHLNRAMAKPHLASRAQAVVLAYETGPVVPNTHAPGAAPRRP
ncbi:LuxR C-terminal-related transcriptional regulator [Phytohabitans sp. ZYX-F-186]|uniref:LuxR C-terminal-related transcriptional regulator n=1 Tax=Phytohabitans maris TaxID=3071409 RepID=A0ABU0ZFT4_9ACTN|nr:LuxR C-terminal-related transcriptional regulator [Phytohabitans sp. ZYX-F-186]MDQ7905286.1 LuxR C-terminal-related transcriptional regulator [Phytohabitans sp. ZYX-F-186]